MIKYYHVGNSLGKHHNDQQKGQKQITITENQYCKLGAYLQTRVRTVFVLEWWLVVVILCVSVCVRM